MKERLPSLLELAVEAARCPHDLILSGFRSESLSAERKSDGSPVTHYDREAERMIRAFIAERQPEDWPVLGEEFGGDTSHARYRWVIDPIDGTLAFSRGLAYLRHAARVRGRRWSGARSSASSICPPWARPTQPRGAWARGATASVFTWRRRAR